MRFPLILAVVNFVFRNNQKRKNNNKMGHVNILSYKIINIYKYHQKKL